MKKRQAPPRSKKRKPRHQFQPDDLQDIDWSKHDAVMSERSARILKNVRWPAGSTERITQSITQRKPEGETLRPPTGVSPEVTPEEWQEVCHAYAQGREQEEAQRAYAKDAATATRDLKRFLRFWGRLSPIVKNDLAEPEENAEFYEGKRIEHAIVLRARESLKRWQPPGRGRPPHLGYLEAAKRFAEIWKSRGLEAKPGRLHSDKAPMRWKGKYEPNPFVTFISRGLRCLDPNIKSDEDSHRQAKTAVDTLAREGFL